jgi:hypothetical protein
MVPTGMRFQANHDRATTLTFALRSGQEPLWDGLRGFLQGKGFDPDSTSIGDLFPEDTGEFGVAVTQDRRAFKFVVNRRTGVVLEWHELPDADSRFAYSRSIFAAMKHLDRKAPSDRKPLDILVEYVAHLTHTLREGEIDRWRPPDYWRRLHEYMDERDLQPRMIAAIDWYWNSARIDGALVATGGSVIHFIGSLEGTRSPIGAITLWESLTLDAAHWKYGELVEAGQELLRREADDGTGATEISRS